ncbi:MAG: M20/M25/M40 family metallo-hydrolase [Anaerolineales bacterium]|nr:M20/M25/M40 family metallo-hydrolase [Anaerolineales bacterium]
MKLNRIQQEEVLSFAQQLIRVPGTSGNEGQVAPLVNQKMRELGYDQVQIDPYGSVIGVIKGSRPGPTLLFDGHMDVVPIREPEQWSCDPYGAVVVDGKLMGRGSADMKGSLAAMICAASYIDRAAFAGTIIVSASVAEELMPGRALEKILDTFTADAVVIGEPTDLRLGFTEKGRCTIAMNARGRVAHSSRPELGENAIYYAVNAIDRIKAAPLHSDSALGSEVIELVEIRSSPSPGNGTVPDQCWGLWECRLLPGESEQALLARLANCQKDAKWQDKISFTIETIDIACYTGKHLVGKDFLPGWKGDENSGIYRQMQAAIEKSGIPLIHWPIPYGCNALASCGLRGLPTVIFGPGNVECAHKPNEYLEVRDLWKATEVFGLAMELNGVYA